eukprot:2999474-Rhodomonas_salina.1
MSKEAKGRGEARGEGGGERGRDLVEGGGLTSALKKEEVEYRYQADPRREGGRPRGQEGHRARGTELSRPLTGRALEQSCVWGYWTMGMIPTGMGPGVLFGGLPPRRARRIRCLLTWDQHHTILLALEHSVSRGTFLVIEQSERRGLVLVVVSNSPRKGSEEVRGSGAGSG